MKKIIGILIVIAIIVVAIVMWTRKAETPEEPAMEGETPAVTDEGTAGDLESVDLGDLEGELEGIDSELEGLE